MSFIVSLIDQCSRLSGRVAAWGTTLLVILICSDVFMRYFLNISHVWVTELECHLFALIFLIGAAYTLNKDAHVRVDLFYTNFSERKKAVINLLGVLLFLLPWCLIVIRSSIKYAKSSYRINETSPDPGGLPALWIIKFMIVLAFLLLILEALSLFIRSLQVIRRKQLTVFPNSDED